MAYSEATHALEVVIEHALTVSAENGGSTPQAEIDALLDAFGVAVTEGAEILMVRSPLEKTAQDGSPIVELLEVQGNIGRAWLCLTGNAHAAAFTQPPRTVRTAVMSLKTLLSMAEDLGIEEVLFNPDRVPNLSLGRRELREVRRRAERCAQQKREQKLKKAGTNRTPGWIM